VRVYAKGSQVVGMRNIGTEETGQQAAREMEDREITT
jgi:hypothetical protein